MMKCMTVDDEPLALKQLNKYISQVPFLELAGSFDNGLKASAFIADNPVDLVFIDIDMPDMNGLEFVRALINHPMIVFTTAYSEYAIESYKLDAVDYPSKRRINKVPIPRMGGIAVFAGLIVAFIVQLLGTWYLGWPPVLVPHPAWRSTIPCSACRSCSSSSPAPSTTSSS